MCLTEGGRGKEREYLIGCFCLRVRPSIVNCTPDGSVSGASRPFLSAELINRLRLRTYVGVCVCDVTVPHLCLDVFVFSRPGEWVFVYARTVSFLPPFPQHAFFPPSVLPCRLLPPPVPESSASSYSSPRAREKCRFVAANEVDPKVCQISGRDQNSEGWENAIAAFHPR